MQLRFTNLFRKASAVIDVKAKPSSEPAKIPAVITHAAPDLSDYGVEYKEPLPSWGRFIPWAFRIVICAICLFAIWNNQQSSAATKELTTIRKIGVEKTQKLRALTAQTDGLKGKVADLRVLQQWAAVSESVRAVLVAAMSSCNERVLIKTFELKRRDNNAPRYNIQLTCSGSSTNFDIMRADLSRRLTEAGWSVNEAQADPNDSRMVFDAIISRKNTAASAAN